jgi:hypothetical protein
MAAASNVSWMLPGKSQMPAGQRQVVIDSDESDEDDEARRPLPDGMGRLSKALFVFDNYYLKPFLIYRYSYSRQKRDNAFFEHFEKQATSLKKLHFAAESYKAGAS